MIDYNKLISEGVDFFERDTIAVNRKSVIVGNGNIFCATLVFLPVVPIFMVTGAGRGFGLSERTAVFLPCSSVFADFTVFAHSKTGFTYGMT